MTAGETRGLRINYQKSPEGAILLGHATSGLKDIPYIITPGFSGGHQNFDPSGLTKKSPFKSFLKKLVQYFIC